MPDAVTPELRLRTITAEDYGFVIRVVDEWWGGRPMAAMLPRLFFVHFRDTSFVAEANGVLVGFVIGFLSPTLTEEAYIHFVGVHPDFRKLGVGRMLYEQFFGMARRAGRDRVRALTSPLNANSIAFHRSMGFQLQERIENGEPVSTYKDYDGPGEDRVLLTKVLHELEDS